MISRAQEGFEYAEITARKAAQSGDTRGALGVEWAVIHLMNNDLDRARLVGHAVVGQADAQVVGRPARVVRQNKLN